MIMKPSKQLDEMALAFAECYLPEKERKYFRKAKKYLKLDPEVSEQDLKEFSESRIPEKYREGYDFGRTLASLGRNRLREEAIRYGESLILGGQKKEYEKAKSDMWERFLDALDEDPKSKARRESKQMLMYYELVESYVPDQADKAKF